MARPILGDDPFNSSPSAEEGAKRGKAKGGGAGGRADSDGSAGAKAGSRPKERGAKQAKSPAKKASKKRGEKSDQPAARKRAPERPKARAAAPSVEPARAARVEPAKVTRVEPSAAEVAPTGIAAPSVSSHGSARVATAETRTSVPPPPPPPPPAAPSSEYGPSIDHPPQPPLRRRLADGVHHFEDRVRARLGPGTGMAPSPRRLPLEFVLKRWRALAMRDRSDVVDEFGRDPRVAADFAPLLDFLYKSYFRVDARGMANVPDEGQALIVANHSGTLPYDGAMIMHAVRKGHPARREVRPLVEDFVFHFPYLGTLMNRIGGVRACQENAERLLAKGQLVAVFPEGIKGIGKLYAQRYQLQRFGRGGFVKLALATDSPIIPTAVVGAEEIHPMLTRITWLARSLHIPYIPITPTFPWLGPLGLVPLPTKWYLAFGEPLYFNAEYGAEAAGDRILVNKLAEQVRQRIQEMIDALLKERRSVVFG